MSVNGRVLGPAGRCGTLIDGVLCQMPPIGVKIAAQGDVKVEQNFAEILDASLRDDEWYGLLKESCFVRFKL